jgi:shikimate kinase
VVGAIVLVGPMGSGKTTLGKKLAKELGLEFLDTDKLVASKHGAITKIFETRGEDYFRSLETRALAEALEKPAVVATGGGVVISETNRNLISGHHVIFLDTSAEHVIGKINLSKRPLLKDNPDRWDEIYNQRLPLYKSVATQEIFTGGKSLRALVQEIKEGL